MATTRTRGWGGPTASSAYLERFTLTERTLHWVHASAFFVLLGSGLVLYVPRLSAAVGRRPEVKSVHLWTAVAWAAAILVVVAFGDRRRLAATLREIDGFDEDDRLWLRRIPTRQGRFNAGQKLNVALTAAFALLFAVSGLLLWLGERDTRFRFDSTVVVHDALMWISLVVVAGHLYLALVYPATRHALRGITRGTVRRDWAEQHHPKWAAPRFERRQKRNP